MRYRTCKLKSLGKTGFHVRGQSPVADQENFGGGDDKNFKPKTSKIRMCCNQARSQKFAMERLFYGSGGGAPSAQKFCIFLQK